eukprot:scaffold1891_cov139-Skeletonema_menzelii.AAC.2
MSAINKDGSLNVSMLERQVREDMAIYTKSRAEDGMKKRALHTSIDYDEFKNLVSASQLKPIGRRDVSSLFNGCSGSHSTLRNRTVHGGGIGCLDGYIDEKKKNENKMKEMTTKSQESKGISSSAKSSRDAYNFVALWKQQCSSSAGAALSFLLQMEEKPETICEQYFSADIDSDVVGDIVSALHLLMCLALDKNDHNDESVVALIAGTSDEPDSTLKFISSWLKAMTTCGRFDLAISFMTATQESQLKEIVEFVKTSTDTENADDDYLRRYNDLLKR